MKTFLTNFKKITLSIILFFAIFLLSKVIQFAKYTIDEDSCVDTGICAEGLKFGNDIMSKEYCLEKGKKWDDKRKECDMAIESRTCEKQGYKWITTEGRCSHKIIKNW